MSFVQKALDAGWSLAYEPTGIYPFLSPPTGHEAIGWAAKWITYPQKGTPSQIRVPHWLPDVVEFNFAERVEFELLCARDGHAKQNSTHEGYAVLKEEVEEFWDEVKKKRQLRDNGKMLLELVQVAAMAQRCAEDNGLI